MFAALKSFFFSEQDFRRADILAFRTITTLLSLFQPHANSPPPTHSKAEHDELMVLDSFAALLVRQHEVAGVISTGNDGSRIQVLASVVRLDNSGPLFTDTFPQPTNPLWWIASINPRTNPPKNNYDIDPSLTSREVSLDDPVIPEELLAEEEKNLLDTFLRTQWHKETFSTHTWMLKTLLRRSGSEDGLEALQLYVIAVCSDKMKYRLSNGPSPLYFDCLLRLCGKTFPFIEHPDILPTRRDGSHRDQFFLDAIPMLADFSMTKIPNLEKVAQLALEKKPFEVYNKDTYMEYHGLLCELLKCFRGSLTDLVGLKSQDVKQIRQALTDVRIFGDLLWTMVRGAAIEKHLQTVADFLDTPGVVKVNKGGVVGVNKEGVVGVDKEGVVGVDEEGVVGVDEEGVVGVDEEGVVGVDEEGVVGVGDQEFEILKPFTICRGKPLQPWESYRDWLRLQIVYFDAIQTTTRYVSSIPSLDISIKILTPSLPDTDMLPWSDLLTNDRYFPQPLGKDLFDFLAQFAFDQQETELEGEGSKEKKGKCKEKKGQHKEKKGQHSKATGGKGMGIETSLHFEKAIKLVKQMQEQMQESEIDTLVDSAANWMKSLKNYSLSPPDRELPDKLCTRVLRLKNRHLPFGDRLEEIHGILETLDTMKVQSSLYQKLRTDTPLCCGKRFSGTRHCEACLASLKYLSGLPWSRSLNNDALLELLLAEFRATGACIGVSKLCCPVCAYLLTLLKIHDDKFFNITGEHSRISPCTLPEWLPGDIIKAMVDEFGTRLKVELVKFRRRKGRQIRERSGSSETRRLSVESLPPAIRVPIERSVLASLFTRNRKHN